MQLRLRIRLLTFLFFAFTSYHLRFPFSRAWILKMTSTTAKIVTAQYKTAAVVLPESTPDPQSVEI